MFKLYFQEVKVDQIDMAQMPALIPKEVEIQRLKKIYIMVIMLGSIAASVEVDNFVDGSLHQTAIRDSAFTPAHWWLYSHFIALPLGWGFVAMYRQKSSCPERSKQFYEYRIKDNHNWLLGYNVYHWYQRNVAFLVRRRNIFCS